MVDGKKLVLLKTLYYRRADQNGTSLGNSVQFSTQPQTESESLILRLTDKNYNPIDNGFIEINTIIIPADNSSNSGITKQVFQETLMIKTKSDFVSANTFYFDSSSSNITTIDKVEYPVTSGRCEFKNASLVRIEYDNDGTKFSNGKKFARRVSIFACE
jgi:hypothetical protein